ncbi:MAG TPA: histidine kinase [Terriglobia bacterium]
MLVGLMTWSLLTSWATRVPTEATENGGTDLGRFGSYPLEMLHRLRQPLVSNRRRQGECILASARVVLAVGCAIALYFDPGTASSYSAVIRGLAVAYVAASIVLLLLARASSDPSMALQVTGHVIDLMWTTLICLLRAGPNGPVVVIFFFAVLAAAYRWGFAETLGTAAASVLLMGLGRVAESSAGLRFLHLPLAREAVNTFIAQAICLLLVGGLLAYLAEREKSFRARILAVSQVLANAGSEAGLRETVERALEAVRTLVVAGQVALAVREERSGRAFLWELNEAKDGQRETVRFSQLLACEHERYFFSAPSHSWYTDGSRRAEPGGLSSCLMLGADGKRLPDRSISLSAAFFDQELFQSLFVINFAIRDEWSGRLFLLNNKTETKPIAELQFLQSLVWQSVPSIYNVYILRRLRSRLRAQERLRVAHELHDGLLQSLISIEMELKVLRGQVGLGSPNLAEDLGRLQRALRPEIQNVRSLMERLKLQEMSPAQMLDTLSDMVARFQQETGISSSFVCDSDPIELSSRVCREIACILQEALTNVRKHSGARNVQVRFALETGWWKLVVADDGRGFEFSGRLRQTDLDRVRAGPVVLSERARLIGADVEIESVPGHGSSVEVYLRQQESYG